MKSALTPSPTDMLAGHVAAIAGAAPEQLAVQLQDGTSWSYGRLAAAIDTHAKRIAACGLAPGGILAQSASARELLPGALAAPLAGHGFLPLDPETADSRWPALQTLGGPRLQRIDRLPELPCAPPANGRASGSELALVIATSGSEGTPKAVVHTHASLAAAARASAHLLPLTHGDAWLNCLPLCHIGGQAILWRCFMAGAAVLLHDRFDAEAVWQAIRRGEVTHVSLVPAMLAQLLDAADGPPPARLRAALIGGASLSRPLRQRAVDAGWPLFVSYGMSESAAQIATLPPCLDWHEGLVGRPLPGVGLSIAADGRIRIAGGQLMRGYLDAEDTPGLGLEDGSFLSGDLGRIDDHGRLIVLGRADDMLISGGRNIHPQEIEARLCECPGIVDSAVTATPDPVWGDIITALVVASGETGAIERWCRESLPAALRPRRIVRVSALPRTPLGKLERKALPALLAEPAT